MGPNEKAIAWEIFQQTHHEVVADSVAEIGEKTKNDHQ